MAHILTTDFTGKDKISIIAPDKDGNFEMIITVKGESVSKPIDRDEALSIVQFLVKYL